jgi:hypothetical protein
MARLPRKPKHHKHLVALGLSTLLIFSAVQLPFMHASGEELGPRSLKLSSADASATPEEVLSFTLTSTSVLGSVYVQFCSNDPLPGTPCTPSAGLDATGVVLLDQTGPGDFAINPAATTTNSVLFTRPPSSEPAGPVSFHLSGITNPSSPGSYYVRLQTYASTNGSGPAVDRGGIAYVISNSFSITATVPPFLIFCTGVTIPGLNCANASGDYIDFGELSSTRASSGSSQMLAATNARDGYNVTVTGTTMTSGNNTINALSSNDVSRPGTAQFGLNLRANVAPAGGRDPTGPGAGLPKGGYAIPNSFRFVDGETIISSTKPDDMREYTASYITNVPKLQAPGVYVSTLTYICLATF